MLVFDLPGQHVIAAHLIFDCPLSAEDRALEGVATICARTLDEGTRTHGGEEFAELLETEGAGFGIDVSLSGLQAVLDVPASRLESAFALFAEAVQEPALERRRREPARAAAAGRDRAGPGQLGADRRDRVPPGGVRRRPARRPDERRRAGDGRGGHARGRAGLPRRPLRPRRARRWCWPASSPPTRWPWPSASSAAGRTSARSPVRHEAARAAPRTRRADRSPRRRPGRPPARRLRARPQGSAVGGSDRRQLRDGRGVPVPAERGAARGEGLHLRSAAQLRPAAQRRLVRGPGVVPHRGPGGRRTRGPAPARRRAGAVHRGRGRGGGLVLHGRVAAALRHRRRRRRSGRDPGAGRSARRLRRPEPGRPAGGDAGVGHQRVPLGGRSRRPQPGRGRTRRGAGRRSARVRFRRPRGAEHDRGSSSTDPLDGRSSD